MRNADEAMRISLGDRGSRGCQVPVVGRAASRCETPNDWLLAEVAEGAKDMLSGWLQV